MAIPGYDFNRILSNQQRPQQVLPDIGVSQSFNPSLAWDQGISTGGVTPVGTPTIGSMPVGTPTWNKGFNPSEAWAQVNTGGVTPMGSTPPASKPNFAVPSEAYTKMLGAITSKPSAGSSTMLANPVGTSTSSTGKPSTLARPTTPTGKPYKRASTSKSKVGGTSASGIPSIPPINSVGATGSGINLNFGYTPDLGFTSSFSSVIDPSLLSGLDSSIQALRSPSTSVGATRSPMGPAYEPEPSMFNTLASWGGEAVDMLNPFSDDITPGATGYNQGFLSPEAQLRLFGGTDAMGNKYRGALGPLTRGLGVLFRGWTGKESIDIAKDMAAGQQAAYQQNMQAQAQAYNTALEAQYRSQSGEYEGKDEDVAKYMEENGIKV